MWIGRGRERQRTVRAENILEPRVWEERLAGHALAALSVVFPPPVRGRTVSGADEALFVELVVVFLVFFYVGLELLILVLVVEIRVELVFFVVVDLDLLVGRGRGGTIEVDGVHREGVYG